MVTIQLLVNPDVRLLLDSMQGVKRLAILLVDRYLQPLTVNLVIIQVMVRLELKQVLANPILLRLVNPVLTNMEVSLLVNIVRMSTLKQVTRIFLVNILASLDRLVRIPQGKQAITNHMVLKALLVMVNLLTLMLLDNLGMVNLVTVNLGMANLGMVNQVLAKLQQGVNLGMANLGMANLGMANQVLAKLQQGVNLGMANLGMANLGMANLQQGVNLVQVHITVRILVVNNTGVNRSIC
jgi:hypothetical protein